MSGQARPRVVIVGAEFGGVWTVRSLARTPVVVRLIVPRQADLAIEAAWRGPSSLLSLEEASQTGAHPREGHNS